MKIIAVGMNYAAHNKELDGTLSIPEEPVIFSKADSALLKDGKPFFIPDFTEQCEYETELVVRICRLGKSIAPRFAHRYYDAVTVGIDFTARDMQRRFRAEGRPWELCKGFDGSAVVGTFVPVEEWPDIQRLSFRLDVNGQTVQSGCSADMIFTVDELVAYVSRFYTLKMGDLIYTGTPAGVGPVHINDHLEGYIEERKLLDFNVR
ncbi:MAG: fumarylacetoacetate hydrolase family protein [Paraprevotella sp.]|jgi:FAH family protein|nr:fumarylacetoacetate hydrolase family protein [Paraprevotella sp.]MBP3472327.1 fumarylacetoacetate hydrolase family protein [Paraprevotella sp.]